MSELKECPFCGAPAERKSWRQYKKGVAATVGCTAWDCPMEIEQATLTKDIKKAFRHAENVWNRRPTPTNKPKTNGDKIRSMSDETLAETICCPYDNFFSCTNDGCEKCKRDWLKQEVEG